MHGLENHLPILEYRATNSQELRTSMLATTRILVSKLATARVFCYAPTTPSSLMAPSSSSRDLSVPTIKRQGQRHLSHRLRQSTHRRRLINRIGCLDGFWVFFLSLYSSDFYSLLCYSLNVTYMFRFEKLAMP